jgi:hypothetical protein
MAMRLLRQAIDGGYRDLAFIRKDADLDPLRGRKDFDSILDGL